MNPVIFYCPKCGGTRWRTKKKDELWQCQACGFIGSGVVDPPKIVKDLKKIENRTNEFQIKNGTIIPPRYRMEWWRGLLSFIIHIFKHD